MLRFAPSPTGDMYIANLRVALFNYLVATQNGEDLMLRIEDIDKDNIVEGKDKEIQDILGLFGIEYNQVLYQSEHKKFHRRMAIDLLQKKNAFNCFCSIEAKNRDTSYEGRCQELRPEEIIDNDAEFVIRLRKPDTNLEFSDLIEGNFSFTPDEVDSFVIMDKDKNPTYNFACAIDDMIADVSVVIRSQEYKSNTPKQIAIRHALGYDKNMKYAHVPDLLNAESVSVKSLLEEGFIPEAITNYLISLGSTPPKEIFSFKEAKEWFDISKVSNSPVNFDKDTLRFINREHLALLDNKELSRYVGFADDEIGALAKLYLQEEVSTLKELRSKIEPVFAEKIIPDTYKKEVELLSNSIKSAPYFDKYADFERHVMDETNLSGDNFLIPLRVLLTGAENRVDIARVYSHVKNYLMEIVK